MSASTQAAVTRRERAGDILRKVADMFTDPRAADTLLGYCAAPFIQAPEIPSTKYSWHNRMILAMQDAMDARGFRAWEEAGRHVKRGSKAVWILAPSTKKVTDDDGNEDVITTGFRAVPVFRVEDTEGRPLPVYLPRTLPPLHGLAAMNGLEIKYQNTRVGEEGYYSPIDRTISLSTEDPAVYLHELMHHYDRKLGGRSREYRENETVAELGACVLARMYGIDNARNSWSYIASYAGENTAEAVGRLCGRVYERTARCIARIIEDAESIKEPVPVAAP